MKVLIDSDEWWPVYFLHPTMGDEVEVDEVTLERWRQATENFNVVQDEMHAAWCAARVAKNGWAP